VTTIEPYILGSGAASKAIQKSLSIVDVLNPSWGIAKPHLLKRNQKLKDLSPKKNSVLFLANPHALHSDSIQEAEQAGFSWVICEKPAAVSLEQLKALEQVKIPVAVFHGYRQTWGIQTLKKMLEAGELGAWITIEGRYWQSSAGHKKQSGDNQKTWKDDIALSGAYDVLLDLTTHWADLVFFLAGETPEKVGVWKSFVNSNSDHRDTHNHVTMEFSQNRRSMGSISKTAHGSGNDLEIHVIGKKRSVSWAFMNPDELVIGEGGKRTTLHRPDGSSFGSEQYPFHSTGWLEGYVEIIKQYFHQMRGEAFTAYPNLKDQSIILRSLFQK
jgi:predicted dehydrogenase